MKLSDYPGVSSFADRHGKQRWRFRSSGGLRVMIPGEPHTPAFDAAYQAATEGRIKSVKQARIVRHPRAASPHSLLDCWFRVRNLKSWWDMLDPLTRDNYSHEIETFLDSKSPGGGKWGDGPIEDFKPRHVRDIMEKLTPSRARILMTVLRRMMKEAILQEWIEYDPTRVGIDLPKRRNKNGHKAWPPHFCAKFELRWPLGTTARTAYELARWMAVRRSDIALLRHDQMVTKLIDGERVDGFLFVQHKGRNRDGAFEKFHPISEMVAEAIAARPVTGDTVLAKADGSPYNMKSLSSMMRRDWAPAAGIPAGYTLHGLRKAMGGMLADAGATAHQSRDVLGHATMKEVEFYARSRDQAKAATDGMRKVVRLVRRDRE
jgi:hypothetical protein